MLIETPFELNSAYVYIYIYTYLFAEVKLDNLINISCSIDASKPAGIVAVSDSSIEEAPFKIEDSSYYFIKSTSFSRILLSCSSILAMDSLKFISMMEQLAKFATLGVSTISLISIDSSFSSCTRSIIC